MCGILGAIHCPEPRVFERGLNAIAHRGPDGFGVWQSDDNLITLGHRRLAILDLSEKGKQPMHFRNYAITFNGEIYNFLEIRKELKAKGYQFTTESDTEIVLAAFTEWKEACLHKFNGMWAIAIWDKEKKELFLSRDRFGKKPLFYSFIGAQFIFASEMKAIFPFLPSVKPSVDFEWCKNNVFAYEATDKCLIEGIKRFPAGHFAYLSQGQKVLAPKRFWNTMDHLTDVPTSYDSQVEKFRELFMDACRLRMRSDVPIGTALSGGLDSSATICAMAHIASTNPEMRITKDWQHAFVATFPGTFLDESMYAQKVVDRIGIQAAFLPIEPAKGIDKLFRYQYLFEELYITSPIPMMDLYGSVRKNGVVVTIDGHGADELFCGYGKDIYKAFADCGANVFQAKEILKTYEGLRNIDHIQVTREHPTLNQYWEYMRNLHSGGVNVVKYYIKSMIGLIKSEKPSKGQLGDFNTFLFQLFHQTVLPTLLRNYDRYAMANGVEIRMPFMDHRLVSYCFSLPWQSKIRKGFTKTIVRDALKDIMPEEVVWRKSKIGFNTPIVDWIKGEWKEFLLDEIGSADYRNCTLIDTFTAEKNVLKVMKDPKATFSDGERAWIGLMPYFWEKAMIKSGNW
jgi:asparagine synthase (glutamine-hydrolysing)